MNVKQAFKLQKTLRHFMPFKLSLWIAKRILRIFRDPQPWDYKVRINRFVTGCARQGLVKK